MDRRAEDGGKGESYTEGTRGGAEVTETEFLTTMERGSAEMVTLASVARNEVKGD
jgi:hypothetical protein